jgi:hypothetical protein
MGELGGEAALRTDAARRVLFLADQCLREPERETLLPYAHRAVKEETLRERAATERLTETPSQRVVAVNRDDRHTGNMDGPRGRRNRGATPAPSRRGASRRAD